MTEPASSAFFANMRATGRFYITDPLFAGGAVAGDTVDCTAAIAACNAAAKLVNGTVVIPPGIFKVTGETLVEYNAHWRGESVTVNNCIIRAHSAMRSILAVRSTFGHPLSEGEGAYRSLFENICFDANNLASNCIITLGAAYSEFKDISCLNAPQCGIREALAPNPLTLSSVTATVPGGSPAGITITQLDPNYNGGWAGNAGVYPLRLKCTTGGALDTAQFAISQDNGVTFSLFTQPISAKSNIALADGSGNISAMSGLQAQCPAGTYHVGDHWDITITVINGDVGFPVTANWEVRYDKVVFGVCGMAFATFGFGSVPCSLTLVTGSIAVTAGSPFAVGTGTTFTSMGPVGTQRTAIRLKTIPEQVYQVIGALSDTVLALNPDPTVLPPSNLSGLDFAIGTGAGRYDDGLNEITGHLIMGTLVDGCTIGHSGGMVWGDTYLNHEVTGCGFFGAMFGGTSDNLNETNLIMGDRINSQCKYSYYFAATSNGTWLESHSNPSIGQRFVGNGGGWIIQGQGRVWGLGRCISNVPVHTLYVPPDGPVYTFATAADTIPIPDLTNPVGQGSFLRLVALTPLRLTGTPVLATAPGANGIIRILQNAGSFPITFENAQTGSGSGLGLPGNFMVLGPGEAAIFQSTGRGSFGIFWNCIGIHRVWYNGYGNFGEGTNRVETTNATPTALYTFFTNASVIAAGTAVHFDVTAQSQAGVNVAHWHGLFFSDAASNSQFLIDTAVGTGAGALPPLGWTLTVDPTGTHAARLLGTGDASGNKVVWSVRARHADGSQ